MRLNLSGISLTELLISRGTGYLSDDETTRSIIDESLPMALDRTARCFRQIDRKYYSLNGDLHLDVNHGDHMATFLWFLANSIHLNGYQSRLPEILSYWNRVTHSIDLFYNVEMPEVFLLVHPLGTVLGKAKYSDFLVVYQNVTVGAIESQYPSLGSGVILYTGSKVIGDSHIGANSIVAPGTQIINETVPPDSIVFGHSPDLLIKANRRSVTERVFSPSLK